MRGCKELMECVMLVSEVLQGRSQWDLQCCELVIYHRQLTAGSSHALARYVGQEISAVMCYS